MACIVLRSERMPVIGIRPSQSRSQEQWVCAGCGQAHRVSDVWKQRYSMR